MIPHTVRAAFNRQISAGTDPSHPTGSMPSRCSNVKHGKRTTEAMQKTHIKCAEATHAGPMDGAAENASVQCRAAQQQLQMVLLSAHEGRIQERRTGRWVQ